MQMMTDLESEYNSLKETFHDESKNLCLGQLLSPDGRRQRLLWPNGRLQRLSLEGRCCVFEDRRWAFLGSGSAFLFMGK